MIIDTQLFFCKSCNAGPWTITEKGSNGKSIYNFHADAGHQIVPYTDPIRQKDFTDHALDVYEQLTDIMKKNKDESQIRLEKYGLPIKQIENYLNTLIRNDPILVKQLLRVYFSAYTKNPINMALLAPSSDGKTYATVQIAKLFPKDDIIKVGRLSPTALIHQHGKLIDSNGNDAKPLLLDLERRIVEAKSAKLNEMIMDLSNQRRELLDGCKSLVDLTNKILLFLDNPNPQTYEVLKPILSHDSEEIIYKTTKGDGSLNVKETVIKGWPATIVCSAKNEAKNEVWPEIETRFFMTSPNPDITKYKAANNLTMLKHGLPEWSDKIYDNPIEKKWAKSHVLNIINSLKSKFETSNNPIWGPHYQILSDIFPSNQGVMMRHFSRLLSFCNVETLINSEFRPLLSFKDKEDRVIRTHIVTFADIESAFDTLGSISTVPPEKIKFYDKVFKPRIREKKLAQIHANEEAKKNATYAGQDTSGLIENIDDELAMIKDVGVTSQELADKYTEVFKKPITAKRILENYLNPLGDNGIIQWVENPDNKSQHLWQQVSVIDLYDLQAIKSKLIEASKLTVPYIVSCLKLLLEASIDNRKSNFIFSLNHQILNLEGLVSEINRSLEGSK